MKTIKPFSMLMALITLTGLSCSWGAAPKVSEGPLIKTATPEAQMVESPAPDKFTLVRFATADGQLGDLLKAEAQKAKEAGRTPFVEFYADWCGPCQALRKSLSDQRMIEAFKGTYIIQLNLDEWQPQLGGAGFNVFGIPAFYAIDGEGKPTGRMITGGAWGEDIPENMAPPLGDFFSGKTN